MQLDKTHVAVRLRTMSEIGDLALVMLRRYPASLLAFFAGASIWMVVNAVLLSWIPITEYRFGLDDEEAQLQVLRYAAWMATLVILQTPVAGVLMTSYLGQAVFEETPTWRDVWVETKRNFLRWFWVLGIKRLAIPAMIIVAIRWRQEASGFWDVFVPILLLTIAIMVRASRSFLPEILLLERCPLRSSTETVITASRRSKSLHRPVTGDISGRFLATSFVLVGLFFSIFFTLISIRGLAIGLWNLMDLAVLLVLYPLSLWVAAAVSVLVRFLVYLDTRIRLEGWEVELAMQAEAMRQFGDESAIPSSAGVLTRLAIAIVFSASLLTATAGAQSTSSDQNSPAERSSINVDAAAQDNPLDGSIWFDAQRGQVVPVTVQPQANDSLNRDSRWLPKPKRLKQPDEPEQPSSTGSSAGGGFWGSGFSISNLLGWLLLFIVLGVLIGLIAKLVSSAEAPESIRSGSRDLGRLRLDDEQIAERIKHLPAELRRTDVNLRSEAERLMKVGQYDHAIILLFGHQLLLLDHGGLLRLNRGKTNRKYVRETASADRELSRRLLRTVNAFERSYFGRHKITAAEFSELWQSNSELENQVQTLHEVAA